MSVVRLCRQVTPQIHKGGGRGGASDLSRLMGKVKGYCEEQWFLFQAMTMKDGISLLCSLCRE